MTYTISCHCGRVRIGIEAELKTVYSCNCSVCTRSGFLHWYVEPHQVSYLTPTHGLSTYIWRTVTGGQHFCSNCGNALIRTSTQFPPPISVNARCIEGVDIATLDIQPFDGRSIP